MFGVIFLHLLLDLDIAILMHTFESAFESLRLTLRLCSHDTEQFSDLLKI